MKKVMSNYRTVMAALVMIFTLTIAETASATEKNDNPVELKYIGKLQNQPLFELNINGEKGAEYLIRITDEHNSVIYTERVKLKGEKVVKKFQLNQDDLGNTDLTFEVINRETNKVTSYKVSNSTRMVQDIEIAKL